MGEFAHRQVQSPSSKLDSTTRQNRPATAGSRAAAEPIESLGGLGPTHTIGLPVSATKIQRRENRTGLPDSLKSGIEHLSGLSLDAVQVNYNSAKPAALDALAYTRGSEIEIGPGQEHHLAHESWHVVQQMQGRVRPRVQLKGRVVNDDTALEREADEMGRRALRLTAPPYVRSSDAPGRVRRTNSPVTQLQPGLTVGQEVLVWVADSDAVDPDSYEAKIVKVSDDGSEYSVEFANGLDQVIVKKTYAQAVVRSSKKEVRAEVSKVAPWKGDHLGFDAKQKEAIGKIVGESESIVELSEDQLEAMISYLGGIDSREGSVDRLIHALQRDLADLKANNETPEAAAERRIAVEARTRGFEDDAFETQFGSKVADTDHATLESEIDDWWFEIKAAEADLTFATAFADNRMTARQVNLDGRRGAFKVRKRGESPDEPNNRSMFLDNRPEGIKERTDPRNFKTDAMINAKGLHDLSASLLNGDGSKGIREQLKPYKRSIVLFAPLPEESDLRIFSALARLGGMPAISMRTMSNLLTRPTGAQSSDMGTVYVDSAPGTDGEGSFSYGVTGTAIRTKGDRARRINEADAADRKRGALDYKAVASAAITKVNEIVMAYRHYNSEIFPMLAAWNEATGRFDVLGPDFTPNNQTILNDGTHTGI